VEVARLAAVRWLYPGIPLTLLIPSLVVLGLLVPVTAGVHFSQLGFRRWRDWTPTERSYFLQVIVLANVIFPLALGARLAQPVMAASLWTVFVPYLFFGFYQELVYRGLVQLELVRRWGAPVGIIVANLLFTFGPLHWQYFGSPGSVAGPMFASIFAIGLFFGMVYRRSGNLWMVAIFHAIGNAYIVWSLGSGQG
jgi:membrane protease YdiL (CAAX protease family)